MFKFYDIIDHCKKKQVAFILNVVESNVLLLILELALKDRDSYLNDMDINNVIKSIINKISYVVKKDIFITLKDLECAEAQLTKLNNRDMTKEDIKRIVELIWNSRDHQ